MPVWVDSWQIECCGDPFSVGDAVEWGLVLDSPSAIWPGREIVELDVIAEPYGDEDWRVASNHTTLSRGAIRLFHASEKPLGGQVRVCGIVREDHHIDIPEFFPDRPGVVAAIWVVSQDFEYEVSEHAYSPNGSPPVKREVRTAPKWYASPRPVPGEVMRCELGVLVQLAISDD